jgi:hypothetical protein
VRCRPSTIGPLPLARFHNPHLAAGASPNEIAVRAHLDQLRAGPLRPPVPEVDTALRDRLDELFVPANGTTTEHAA